MSLEQRLEENTAALKALTEAVLKAFANQGTVVVNMTPAEISKEVAKQEKKSETKKSTAEPASSPSDVAPAATEPKDDASAPTADTSLSPEEQLKEISASILRICAVEAGRDKPLAIAALAKFGAKNAKQVKPEDYAALAAELAAIESPADDLT